jgi:putative membrane protein (TIGR04086 family)
MRNDTVNDAFSVIKGVGFAVAASLLGAIVFAVILRSWTISNKTVYSVNQTLKSIALAFGVLFFVRGEKGWLKGGLVGILFTAVSYLAFSALGGDFSLSWLIFAELALGVFVGALSGIIAVNMNR